jgi:uncharacterized protein
VAAPAELGRRYGLAGNLRQAETWYRKAALLGDPDAANKVGQLMANRGLRAEADDWFQVAAEGGIPDAISNLAKIRAALE